MYPISAVASKFYGYLNYTNLESPLRPIVSSRGSITYSVARKSANIIHPLVGQSSYHLKNIQQHIKEVKVEPGEVMAYYVKALFTSVPMDPSINVIRWLS